MVTMEDAKMAVQLPIVVEDIENDVYDVILISTDEINENDDFLQRIEWKRIDDAPVGPGYRLEIVSFFKNGKWRVTENDITKGENIVTGVDEIKERMEDALLQLSFQRQLDGADGIEHEHNEPSLSIEPETDPYDPKLIRVDPKQFSIDYVVKMIQTGDIDLSPDFQRRFVWDSTQKSRLIESLLLRIPLPVFYLSQDEYGKFKVVDGVQRLTVIRDFMDNQFKLRNLEYLKECNGKWFKHTSVSQSNDNLDQIYVRRIEQTQLSCNIIDPQTPSKVKYDIFRRINTGGAYLNRQEVRNCFENPDTRAFIRKLAASEEFKTATRYSIKPTRMADDEIVLRFIAFYLMDQNLCKQAAYKGDMDAYLDSTVEILNKTIPEGTFESNLSPVEMTMVERAFMDAMKNAYLLFNDHAFRKSIYINKALFLSWSRVLSRIRYEDLKNIMAHMEPTAIEEALENEIKTNSEYSDALSKGTNDVRNVKLSLDVAITILEKNGVEIK